MTPDEGILVAESCPRRRLSLNKKLPERPSVSLLLLPLPATRDAPGALDEAHRAYNRPAGRI